MEHGVECWVGAGLGGVWRVIVGGMRDVFIIEARLFVVLGASNA